MWVVEDPGDGACELFAAKKFKRILYHRGTLEHAGWWLMQMWILSNRHSIQNLSISSLQKKSIWRSHSFFLNKEKGTWENLIRVICENSRHPLKWNWQCYWVARPLVPKHHAAAKEPTPWWRFCDICERKWLKEIFINPRGRWCLRVVIRRSLLYFPHIRLLWILDVQIIKKWSNILQCPFELSEINFLNFLDDIMKCISYDLLVFYHFFLSR